MFAFVIFPNILNKIIQNYDPNKWHLFIDSLKYSLKVVLLHNGNIKPSVPIGHAVKNKETYERTTSTLILKLKNYEQYKWKICDAIQK